MQVLASFVDMLIPAVCDGSQGMDEGAGGVVHLMLPSGVCADAEGLKRVSVLVTETTVVKLQDGTQIPQLTTYSMPAGISIVGVKNDEPEQTDGGTGQVYPASTETGFAVTNTSGADKTVTVVAVLLS